MRDKTSRILISNKNYKLKFASQEGWDLALESSNAPLHRSLEASIDSSIIIVGCSKAKSLIPNNKVYVK